MTEHDYQVLDILERLERRISKDIRLTQKALQGYDEKTNRTHGELVELLYDLNNILRLVSKLEISIEWAGRV
jgi:hypothetical protein